MFIDYNLITMPKTYFGDKSVKTIEILNDQLWYYVFATEELNHQLANFSDKAKEIYTVDLFQNNPHSSRIHVKVGKLNAFQEENKNATFGAYFGMCYEICSKYIITAFDTLISMNLLTNFNGGRGLGPEEKLEKLLQDEGLSPIPNYIIDTVSYLRLRRNHYTHISDAPDNKLSEFIINKASNINTYWATPGTIIQLDFTKQLIRDFTLLETIELIKLTRICIQTIDSHIAGLLNINAVIQFEIDKELHGKRMRFNQITKTSFINKIKGKCRLDFDLNAEVQDIEAKLSSI